MDKKKAHTKAGSSYKGISKDNSASNQCLKILDWFFEKDSITTTKARVQLDIMSPATRILQLKKDGYQISKINHTLTSQNSISHKCVARYLLTQKEPNESESYGGGDA